MALSRLAQAPTREFWRETAAGSFAAQTTTTIQTLIERATILAGGTKKVFGKITLSSVTGTPVVSAVASYTDDGRLRVALTNSGAGSQAAWALDLRIIEANGTPTTAQFQVTTAADPASPNTNRLYVDGTLGDDALLGADYDTAWRTLDKLVRELQVQDALFPNATVTYVHVRGTFGAADHLLLNSLLQARGRIVIGHDFGDCTVSQTGTVHDVLDAIAPAAAPVHDLVCIEFTGITVTAADEGRHLLFNDGAGGHVAPAQIVEVDVGGAHAWVSWRFGASGANPETPAWVVAGDTIQVQIFESAAIIAGSIHLSSIGRTPQGATAPLAGNSLTLLNLRTYSAVRLEGASGACLWVDARNAGGTGQTIASVGSTSASLGAWTADNLDPADMVEYGYADATGTYAFGCRGLEVTDVSGAMKIHGRFTQDVALSSFSVAYASKARSFAGTARGAAGAYYSIGAATTVVTSPPFYATAGGRLYAERCVSENTAAAGLATGHWAATKGGQLEIVNCSGLNDGTGLAALYGVFIDSDGSVIIDGDSAAAIDGKHGRLYNPGGKLRVSSSATVAANVAGGPDLYIGQGASLHLVGDYIKSAANTVASPVLAALNPLSLTQTPGAAFTVATPAADWVADYGATGAIDISGGLTARLGILTGGGGATTSQGCTLRNGARIIHEGAGLDGVGPLFNGGSGAIAWPVAITSDLAAGVPEDCWVYPI